MILKLRICKRQLRTLNLLRLRHKFCIICVVTTKLLHTFCDFDILRNFQIDPFGFFFQLNQLTSVNLARLDMGNVFVWRIYCLNCYSEAHHRRFFFNVGTWNTFLVTVIDRVPSPILIPATVFRNCRLRPLCCIFDSRRGLKSISLRYD